MIEKAPGGYFSPGMGTYKPKKMTEGRYKTNIKPPYLECGFCSYRGPNYNFNHGMLWWKSIKCPVCSSTDINEPTRPKIAPAPHRFASKEQILKDKRHLEFIYNRMLNFHLENRNLDYMIKFKEIINRK